MEKEFYVSPEGIDFRTYSQRVRESSRELHDRLKSYLMTPLSGSNDNIAICLTGSDGRFEKGPCSDIEFVVLKKPFPDVEQQLPAIIDSLKPMHGERYDDDIEVKDLLRGRMNWYKGVPMLVFPGRVGDAVLLHGSSELYAEAKLCLMEEWRGSQGRGLVERLRAKIKEFAKIVKENGVQQYNKRTEIRHYDVGARVAFYDPANNVLSLKAGPLRWSQFALWKDVVRLCRNLDHGTAFNLLKSLPQNTRERIMTLSEHLSVTSGVAEALADHYEFFLQQYHRSQEAYLLRGETAIDIPGECKDRLVGLEAIIRAPLI
ncbi:hypothetical protein HY489_00530 [Candidatus Woesearchaeota archaeon]|nr:hypothetical protein [Candidatus Woesearchaeota archaeon]